jgi:4-oxalocrotonate tautomerase
MPHVQITMLEGRTTEQKRRVVKRITEVLHEELGTDPQGISVALVEVPRDSYARAGVLIEDRQKT